MDECSSNKLRLLRLLYGVGLIYCSVVVGSVKYLYSTDDPFLFSSRYILQHV